MRPTQRSARRLLLLATLLVPSGSSRLAAQGSARVAEPPESVATRYGAALRAGDWDAIARMMHPAATAQFRSLFTPILASDKSGQAAQALFGVSTSAEFAKLADVEMFARFLRNVMAQQGLRDMMSGSTMTVIGHVPEGPDTVHVVYRLHMTMDSLSIAKTDVLSMRKNGSSWGVLLSADLEGMAAALRRRIGS